MNSLHLGASWLCLDWLLVIVVGWLLVGAAGVLALHRFALVSRVLFPVGALLGLALSGVALLALLGTTPEVAVLPIGLPALPFHLRLDSLAAGFVTPQGNITSWLNELAF